MNVLFACLLFAFMVVIVCLTLFLNAAQPSTLH